MPSVNDQIPEETPEVKPTWAEAFQKREQKEQLETCRARCRELAAETGATIRVLSKYDTEEPKPSDPMIIRVTHSDNERFGMQDFSNWWRAEEFLHGYSVGLLFPRDELEKIKAGEWAEQMSYFRDLVEMVREEREQNAKSYRTTAWNELLNELKEWSDKWQM